MILKLLNFDFKIKVSNELPSVLVVENRQMFSRIVQSLVSGEESFALEPYVLMDDDEEILRIRDPFYFLLDPVNLPFKERVFTAGLLAQFDKALGEDEAIKKSMDEIGHDINERLYTLGLPFHGDYSLGVEWELKKYLKTFALGSNLEPDATMLDNLIHFFELYADVKHPSAIALVNCMNYFEDIDLIAICERAFSLKIPLLFLESSFRNVPNLKASRAIITRDFIERCTKLPAEDHLCSGDNDHSGFRAVSF